MTRTTAPREPASAMVDSLSFQLIAASRTIQRRFERQLAEHGMTLRHLGALGHLIARPDLTNSDLARRAGITTQSMHATVRQLEEFGALSRTDPGPGRRVQLQVTAHGRHLVQTGREIAREIDAELFAGASAAQRTAMRATFQGIAFQQPLD